MPIGGGQARTRRGTARVNRRDAAPRTQSMLHNSGAALAADRPRNLVRQCRYHPTNPRKVADHLALYRHRQARVVRAPVDQGDETRRHVEVAERANGRSLSDGSKTPTLTRRQGCSRAGCQAFIAPRAGITGGNFADLLPALIFSQQSQANELVAALICETAGIMKAQ
jgi:hypothetical protein